MTSELLEDLVVRGVELAWAGTFSTIALQAMSANHAHEAAMSIARVLAPIERDARLGWLGTPPTIEVRARWPPPDDHATALANAELLGAAAARDGLDGIARLVAQLEADRVSRDEVRLARAAAVVVEPSVRSGLRGDVLADAGDELEDDGLGLGYKLSRDVAFGCQLGAAACADDPGRAIDRVLATIASIALTNARDYVESVFWPGDTPGRLESARARADEAVVEVTAVGARPWMGAKLARACRVLADGNDRAHVAAIVAQLDRHWGDPRSWQMTPESGAHLLCAAGRTDEAFKLDPPLDVPFRIALAAAYTQSGAHEHARREVAELLDRACLVTRRPLPSVLVDSRDGLDRQLKCADLDDLAQLAFAFDSGSRARLAPRMKAALVLPTTVAEIAGRAQAPS